MCPLFRYAALVPGWGERPLILRQPGGDKVVNSLPQLRPLPHRVRRRVDARSESNRHFAGANEQLSFAHELVRPDYRDWNNRHSCLDCHHE